MPNSKTRRRTKRVIYALCGGLALASCVVVFPALRDQRGGDMVASATSEPGLTLAPSFVNGAATGLKSSNSAIPRSWSNTALGGARFYADPVEALMSGLRPRLVQSYAPFGADLFILAAVIPGRLFPAVGDGFELGRSSAGLFVALAGVGAVAAPGSKRGVVVTPLALGIARSMESSPAGLTSDVPGYVGDLGGNSVRENTGLKPDHPGNRPEDRGHPAGSPRSPQGNPSAGPADHPPGNAPGNPQGPWSGPDHGPDGVPSGEAPQGPPSPDEDGHLPVTTTPEPISVILIGTGLAGVACLRRRRKRA